MILSNIVSIALATIVIVKKALLLSPTKYSIQIEIETTDTILIYLRVTSTKYNRNEIRYKGPE